MGSMLPTRAMAAGVPQGTKSSTEPRKAELGVGAGWVLPGRLSGAGADLPGFSSARKGN